MPGSTTSLATYRPDIPGAMEEFDLQMNEKGYIALQAAPVVEVGSPSESIGKIPLEALLQEVDTTRAPGASYKSPSDWDMATFAYATQENGLKEPIDDRTRRMYREFFDAEVMATKRIRGMVGRNLEKRVAALYHAISTTTAAGTAWSVVSATPMAVVETALRKIVDRTGFKPNTLILPEHKARDLRFVDEIIDRAKYNGIIDVTPDKMNAAILAQIFDVERVIIAGARKNTANVKKTAVMASIWTADEAYLAYCNDDGDPVSPTFARIFHWGEDGSQIGGVVERYRDEDRRSDMVRCRMDTDEKVVFAELAERITGI